MYLVPTPYRLSLEQLLPIPHCLPAPCHPVCGPGQAQHAKGDKASSRIALGIAQPHSSMTVFPQWPYSTALVVSWLLCCELVRIPPPTQASAARREGAVRQGGIRLSGDLFKGTRNARPLGLFCPSLLQRRGGWSSCMKRVWPLRLPHTLLWQAFPEQASRLPLLPHCWLFHHVKRKPQGKQPGETFFRVVATCHVCGCLAITGLVLHLLFEGC